MNRKLSAAMNCFGSLKFSPKPSKNNEANFVRALQRNLKCPNAVKSDCASFIL